MKKLPKKVVVLGGGIGGLSVAHELAERGFEVEIYEKTLIPGGKARSMPVPDSAKDGNYSLPAEHGFRFFPGFYRHITDTMKRIPYKGNKYGVLDNLIGLKRSIYTSNKVTAVDIPTKVHWDPKNQLKSLEEINKISQMEVPAEEMSFYMNKVWQFWTSSKLRKQIEYEKISWWDYIEAGSKSKEYQNYLAKGQTTQLVASKATQASTRTIGEIQMYLLLDSFSPDFIVDRVLNGPTNEVFIEPWIEYLRSLGVKYSLGTELVDLHLEKGAITSIRLKSSKTGQVLSKKADYFVLALPIEVVTKFITPEILEAAPELNGIFELEKHTEWMNGIQYFLNSDLELPDAHASHLDSPWALTSVVQRESIWPDFDFKKYGKGNISAILSVDISDWDTPGILHKLPARDCTPQQIAEETWHQLKLGFNSPSKTILRDEMRESWYLDPDIRNVGKNPNKHVNVEPLLVNLVDSWRLRPNAHTSIPNLTLASDYVRTNTDLASMEGANEAGRRAANHIIRQSKTDSTLAEIWEWDVPLILKPFIWYDTWRFKRGLPWKSAPWVVDLGFKLLLASLKVYQLLSKL